MNDERPSMQRLRDMVAEQAKHGNTIADGLKSRTPEGVQEYMRATASFFVLAKRINDAAGAFVEESLSRPEVAHQIVMALREAGCDVQIVPVGMPPAGCTCPFCKLVKPDAPKSEAAHAN